ncbi:MAG: ABC transporter ATP-binding protein [bacterium]|nr:ABC transporter ATP-binding protein [bacterium]
MALIEVNALAKVYSSDEVQTPVLHGVSFTIASGEFVAIMGPSGSGKSTLLHILGFLDRQTGGTYRFDGREIGEHTDRELARVRNEQMGFVFQSFNLLPRTSVMDNVRLPLLYSLVAPAEWDERTRTAIAAVGLSHRAGYDVAKLSGGERQRVAIARALVNKPRVIFADEPTGNLDSQSGKAVMEILQKLNEHDNHTVVLITHETYTAEHAGRIIRVRDGRIESDQAVAKRLRASADFVK